MTILKAAKNRAFTVSLEDIVFEKPQGGLGEGGGGVGTGFWSLLQNFCLSFYLAVFSTFILFYFILFYFFEFSILVANNVK